MDGGVSEATDGPPPFAVDAHSEVRESEGLDLSPPGGLLYARQADHAEAPPFEFADPPIELPASCLQLAGPIASREQVPAAEYPPRNTGASSAGLLSSTATGTVTGGTNASLPAATAVAQCSPKITHQPGSCSSPAAVNKEPLQACSPCRSGGEWRYPQSVGSTRASAVSLTGKKPPSSSSPRALSPQRCRVCSCSSATPTCLHQLGGAHIGSFVCMVAPTSSHPPSSTAVIAAAATQFAGLSVPSPAGPIRPATPATGVEGSSGGVTPSAVAVLQRRLAAALDAAQNLHIEKVKM